MRKSEVLRLALPLALIAGFGGVACAAHTEGAQPTRLTTCQPGLFTSIEVHEPAAGGGLYALNTGNCGAITNPVGEKFVGTVPRAEVFVLICNEAASMIVNYRGILGSVALTAELAASDDVSPAAGVPTC